jgi:hypothetical protein
MASIREQLLQAARTWIKTALSLSDSKVILAQRDGLKSPRLDLPYYVVNIVSFDSERGVDEFEDKLDGSRVDRGNRSATLRIDGFGADSEEGMQLLGLLTGEFPDAAYCRSLGPLTDVSSIQSESWESRYIKDFTLEYRLVLERANTGAEAAEQFRVTVEDNDGFTTTFTTPPEP